MSYASTVPAAIAALVAAFKRPPGPGGGGTPVRDGPELTQEAGVEAVAVGYTGDQNEDVVTGAASMAGLGGVQDREAYAVMCAIEVIDTGADMAAARTRAYELHAACGAAVVADRTLGGAVMKAVPGTGSLQQQQTDQGARARVVFPVNCEAWTAR